VSWREPGIRPRPSLARQADRAARFAFPAVLTALLVLLAGAPLDLPGRAVLPACLATGCVFFWSLYRPGAMPPALVFLLGVLLDLSEFGPLGVSVLMLLTVSGLAMRWRRSLAPRGFLAVWLAFVAVAAGAAALQWALTSLLSWRLCPLAPGVLQAGLAAGLYPVLAVLLVRMHHTLAEPERA
jgi:rod shape-determining protein MreD